MTKTKLLSLLSVAAIAMTPMFASADSVALKTRPALATTSASSPEGKVETVAGIRFRGGFRGGWGGGWRGGWGGGYRGGWGGYRGGWGRNYYAPRYYYPNYGGYYYYY